MAVAAKAGTQGWQTARTWNAPTPRHEPEHFHDVGGIGVEIKSTLRHRHELRVRPVRDEHLVFADQQFHRAAQSVAWWPDMGATIRTRGASGRSARNRIRSQNGRDQTTSSSTPRLKGCFG